MTMKGVMTERPISKNAAATTECNDGTVCENFAPCVPHPTNEGRYVCDCFKARAGDDRAVNYAGVYCEHQATSYCQAGGGVSAHAFCTNGGECERTVGRTEQHAGCKCPGGYAGDFCQFVEGGQPSDWTVEHFMHPSLASVYGRDQGSGKSKTMAGGIVVGATIAFVFMAFLVFGFVHGHLVVDFPTLRDKFKRNEKESDATSGEVAGLAGRRSSGAFFGGRSVYKKKTATGSHVTPDTLEADGGVLTEALGDQGLVEQNLASVEVEQTTSLDEVDLDGGGELA